MFGLTVLELVMVGFSTESQDLPLPTGLPYDLCHKQIDLLYFSCLSVRREGNMETPNTDCTYFERNGCNLF